MMGMSASAAPRTAPSSVPSPPMTQQASQSLKKPRGSLRSPDSFTFFLSIALLVGLVVGGVGSIPGALVGGLFVLFVPNLAEQVSKGLAGAVYGVILLLLIYVMPSGAAGFASLVWSRLARRRPFHRSIDKERTS